MVQCLSASFLPDEKLSQLSDHLGSLSLFLDFSFFDCDGPTCESLGVSPSLLLEPRIWSLQWLYLVLLIYEAAFIFFSTIFSLLFSVDNLY